MTGDPASPTSVTSSREQLDEPRVSGRRWLLSVAGGVFLAAALVLGAVGYWFVRGFESQPRRVFDAAFASPATEAAGLSGQGTALRGHEASIRFTSPEPLLLRDPARFASIPCVGLRTHFQSIFPSESGWTGGDAELDCRAWSESKNELSAGAWYLRNRTTGTTYFRTWSRR